MPSFKLAHEVLPHIPAHRVLTGPYPLATRCWWVLLFFSYFTKRAIQIILFCLLYTYACPDSKVHGANMGPIWGRQDVGPMNLATRVHLILQEVVAFSVLDFSVQYQPSCDYDRLSYYDGPDATSIEPTVYCGYYVSHIPTSSGDVAIIEFVSNWRYARRGFQITYEAKSKYVSNNASNMSSQMAGGCFDIKKLIIFVWKYLRWSYIIWGYLIWNWYIGLKEYLSEFCICCEAW